MFFPRTDLGFQASQQIMNAADPLHLLRGISQNFPTHAAAMTRVKLADGVKAKLQAQVTDHASSPSILNFLLPLIIPSLLTTQKALPGGKSMVVMNGRLVNPETIEPYRYC